MARQMERHIRCNNLLTVFQSGFHRHHSTTAAVLKVTKDVKLSMEDGFLQAFDLVVHGLLLCKLQNAQQNARLVLVCWWGHILCQKEGIFDFVQCIRRLKLGGGWLCHLLCVTLDMGVFSMLVRMLHRNKG
jgi:hypothetical protein